jgi:hypothetical protein
MGVFDKYVGFEDIKDLNDILKKEFEGVGIEEKEDKDGNKKVKLIIKHPGAFTKWCKDQGFEGVNCECICKALKTDDPTLHKRANFAYNFGFKRNGRTCKCVEELRKKQQNKKGK